MVDVEKIIENGKSMGLMPRRQSVSVSGHGKSWQTISAEQVVVGDVWQDHGLVRSIEDAYDSIHLQIRAGDDGKISPTVMAKSTLVRVFGKSR